MEKFRGKYRVDSTRLKGYDYASDGDYFITICAHQMQHFFGQIIHGEMHLSEIGKLAEKFWKEIPNHFPHAILDEFIIMPNHIHGIITIQNPAQTAHCVVSPENEQTIYNTKNTTPIETTQCAVSAGRGKQDMIAIMPKRGSLAVIIGSYKSVVSKHARKIDSNFKWLERFHDRIIRDNREFHNVQNYIRRNPKNWRKDQDIFL